MDHRSPDFYSLYVFNFLSHSTSRTPEEGIRQQLLLNLVQKLHYPPHVILIEKSLKHFLSITCALRDAYIKRRFDVLIVSPSSYKDRDGTIHTIGLPRPLLLIECKALKVNTCTINQVLCYNQTIRAPCVSVVGAYEQRTGFQHPCTHLFNFYLGIPSFHQLISYYLWSQSQATPKSND